MVVEWREGDLEASARAPNGSDAPGRRRFLRGAAGALLAIPWLPSLARAEGKVLAPERSRAAPRRFVAIKSYSSQRVVDWYPRFSGRGYQTRPFSAGNGKSDGSTICPHRLPEPVGRHSDGRLQHASFAPLSDLLSERGLSTILGPRVARHHPDLLLLRGLDFMPDTSHNHGGMLGNYAGAEVRHPNVEDWPTLDQTLCFSRALYPRPPAGPRSLHLSLGQANTLSFTHHGDTRGSVAQVQAHVDPRTAFEEVFGQNAPEARERRLTLVDGVLDDFRALVRDPSLSRQDRTSLERHVALMHELEGRLRAPVSAACDLRAQSAPSAPANATLEPASLATTCRGMIDVALAAIRCDLTRVVTLDVWRAIGRGAGPHGEDQAYEHNSAKGPRDWHEQVHQFGRPAADRQVRAINRWIADEVFCPLVEGLRGVDEGGRSALFHSVVFWGNELGMNHHNYSVPALLAGRAGGRLAAGRFVDYTSWQRPLRDTQENAPIIEGVPHNRLLVTLAQAFGLSPSDYERPGQPGYGSYVTAGKSPRDYPVDYDASRFGSALPGLLSA